MGLGRKSLEILDAAEKRGDLRTALMALREARASAALLGQLVDEEVTTEPVKVEIAWKWPAGEPRPE